MIAAGALIVLLLAAGITYAATRMFDVAITGTVNLIVSGDAIEVRSGDTRIASGFTLDFGTTKVDYFGRGPVPVRGPFEVRNVSNGPVRVVVTGGGSSGILPLFGPTADDLKPAARQRLHAGSLGRHEDRVSGPPVPVPEHGQQTDHHHQGHRHG